MSAPPPAPGKSRSRLLSLVAVVALVGAPAAVLRALCVGNACAEEESAASEVPFCSLGAEQRELIAAGFEGELHRSPDLLGVTRSDVVVAGGSDVVVAGGTAFGNDDPQPAWPTIDAGAVRVPLLFSGAGVDPAAEIPPGTGLDDVAPTIATIIDFDRPHPGVRSGEAIAGVATGDTPRLVVEVALKNFGSADVQEDSAWPNLQRLHDQGAGTFGAVTGSLPADPAAILTTIGTGGLPHQHGVVGALVRNDEGEVVRAWGPGAPVHVIATLPDDLDEARGQGPLIGLVRSDVSDGGLIGGNWYIENDEDEVITERSDPAGAIEDLMDKGFGRDDVPDVIAVALEGEAGFVDAQLGRIARLVNRTAETTLVVAATGAHPADPDLDGDAVRRAIEQQVPGVREVVTATTPGGLYLDQEAFAETDLTEDDVLQALRAVEGADGRPLFADAFAAIAVSFARYC